jgi:E3 ubiquitin-protein ligase synoviolin
MNQAGAPSTSTTPNLNPPTMFPHGSSLPPPPFFFPSMPFMAPYTIPPPPMPANLDHLTIEELRAMEGNERKHVEERLKLLKNVQTLLNASATLMNQYQMVVANLPPIPIVPQPTPTTCATAVDPLTAEQPAQSEVKPATSSTAETNSSQEPHFKLEDVGSEDHFEDLGTSSSSSLPVTSKVTPTLDNPTSSSSSFIANESSSATSDESQEANEIRKRRLQKFLQNDWVKHGFFLEKLNIWGNLEGWLNMSFWMFIRWQRFKK